MVRFLTAISLLGALLGGLVILGTLWQAGSAPQEAAGYAMACAFAVVPYVLARSAQIMVSMDRQKQATEAAHASKNLLQDIKDHLVKA